MSMQRCISEAPKILYYIIMMMMVMIYLNFKPYSTRPWIEHFSILSFLTFLKVTLICYPKLIIQATIPNHTMKFINSVPNQFRTNSVDFLKIPHLTILSLSISQIPKYNVNAIEWETSEHQNIRTNDVKSLLLKYLVICKSSRLKDIRSHSW